MRLSYDVDQKGAGSEEQEIEEKGYSIDEALIASGGFGKEKLVL